MKRATWNYIDQSRRLRNWDYSSPGGYFITICTHRRSPFFGTIENCEVYLSPMGEIVKEEWEKTASLRAAVDIDEYVIMPNHIHDIIVLKSVVGTPRCGVHNAKGTKSDSLGTIIGQFKSACTRRIRVVCDQQFAWQSRFYGHIIRDDTDLHRIRNYIRENPIKWELDRYYCQGR